MAGQMWEGRAAERRRLEAAAMISPAIAWLPCGQWDSRSMVVARVGSELRLRVLGVPLPHAGPVTLGELVKAS